MDIGFTEEQDLLRTSARRFLENECPSAFVRQRMAEPAATTEEFWQKLAEQGWLGILCPEEAGGSGLGLVDMTADCAKIRVAFGKPIGSRGSSTGQPMCWSISRTPNH
jgi:alkylation response protein AidB-like acyl-CoA dehydrogenase